MQHISPVIAPHHIASLPICSSPEQRRGKALGSIIAWYACQPSHAEVEPAFDALAVSNHFTSPQYSTAFLKRAHLLTFRCIHGLNEGCCATCKELNNQDCVDARGTAKSYDRGALYPSERMAHRGTDRVAPGADTLWHVVPACELHLQCDPTHCEQRSTHCPRSIRLNVVTPEDVEWALQSAFSHSHTMPRLFTNFCFHGGAYTTRDHVCRYLETGGLEPCVIEGAIEPYTINGVTAEEFVTGNVAKIQRELRELRYDRPKGFRPEPAKELCDLVRLGVVSDKVLRNGGKRVSTHGCGGTESDGVVLDRCLSDRRADRMFNAQQPWRYEAPTIAVCRRVACGKPFAGRKGQRHCSDNCRKRSHEEQGERSC